MNKNQLDNFINEVFGFNKLWKEKCNWLEKNNRDNDILPLVKRIIVLGDIHGDWKMLIDSLKIAKVINDKNEWIGKQTVVVQVGDQIDRCRYNYEKGIACARPEATLGDEASDWKILQFMTNLHFEAQKEGGAVYSLMGNHELMNVNGDMRYVSHDGLKQFYDYDNDDLKKNIKEISKYEIKYDQSDDNNEPNVDDIIEKGLDNRQLAFKPGNPISDFLACTRKVSIIIGDYIFVHAGILGSIAKKYSVKNINKIMSLYLWDKLHDAGANNYKKIMNNYKSLFTIYDTSPLWTRKIGNMGNRDNISKEECKRILEPLKRVYEVNKIFVGHTPMIKHGIKNICNENIWFVDYGASRAFDDFDSDMSDKSDDEKISDNNYSLRSDARKIQVLEILNDIDKKNERVKGTEKINILKQL